jgi:hypothetical protein
MDGKIKPKCGHCAPEPIPDIDGDGHLIFTYLDGTSVDVGPLTKFEVNSVKYIVQLLTKEQQAQARDNIGAISAEELRAEAKVRTDALENVLTKLKQELTTEEQAQVQENIGLFETTTPSVVTPPVIGLEYCGGIAVHVIAPGEALYDATKMQVIIAAKNDIVGSYYWDSGLGVVTGATSTGWGFGKQNTEKIVSALGTGIIYAARVCHELSLDGYSDWYLPEEYELTQIAGMGLLDPGKDYWTSTEVDSFKAKKFLSSESTAVSKLSPFFLRPFRIETVPISTTTEKKYAYIPCMESSGIIITRNSWIGAGPFLVDINDPDVTAADIILAVFENSQNDIVCSAEILPRITVYDGGFKIESINQPSADLTLAYKVLPEIGKGFGIISLPVRKRVYKESVLGTKDGINKTFIIPGNVVAYSEEVFVNGLLQSSGSDYLITLGDPSIITFTLAPFSYDVICINYNNK